MPEEREDVEATLEQGTTPDPSQKEKRRGRFVGWLKTRPINKIVGSTLIIEALWVALFWFMPQVLHWWSWNSIVSAEHFVQFYFAWGLGILSLGYIVLILWPIFKKDDDPRWFHARILSSGIVGGAYAFLLPVVMSLPEGNVNSGGAAALRQAILLATGGLIALIALGETRRKNDNDKLKNDQDKEKNDREHERWVKAERRERYAKAVEQLGDEKAPVRMGGVYTLVGLVDDWLEEKSLSDDERLKEGQAIINNLCAYIRSPFTLASYYDELSQASPTSEGIYKDKEEEFYADKAVLESEADVRLGIIKEIHDHIQVSRENDWGSWSNFEYNFSGSVFFYPVELTKSYYKKPVNFSGSHYYKKVNFSGSTYERDASFSTSNFRSTYTGQADFSGSTYKDKTYFSDSTYGGLAAFTGSAYTGETDFSGSTYKDKTYFSDSIYQGGANFSGSTYQSLADFSRSTYQGGAYFSGSTYQGWANFYGSAYQGWADFSRSIYQVLTAFSCSTYKDKAYFSGSTYKDKAYFSGSTYQSLADFNRSTYQGEVNFSGSTYQSRATFNGSIFCSNTYFGDGGNNISFSRFTNWAPQFYDETNNRKALFGSHNNDFTVDTDKGCPINLNSEGLPLGCKFLTSKQKEYLADKFREIEETNNTLLEVKDPKEKAGLSKDLQALNEKLHEWREEATTVKVEGTAPGEQDN